MKATIKLTIGGVEFHPGDTITKKLSPVDEAFLLREGYIEKEESGTKVTNTNKAGKKNNAVASEPA